VRNRSPNLSKFFLSFLKKYNVLNSLGKCAKIYRLLIRKSTSFFWDAIEMAVI
jgi:hypothetical protein